MKVVGRAEDGASGSFAYLYTSGNLNNLETISKGEDSWKFDHASGINPSGLICGQELVGKGRNRQWHAFALLPKSN